ncbi:hypothetical protein CK203_004953 [Vitis vinifera]|uniref:Uncharacterized protein n=1 Tax=Vitis vinifera TaxID=29760 RepID=A0A438KEL3_VITVI|nr:hypothetical protein CK203_004953 [Vitis vinifera]
MVDLFKQADKYSMLEDGVRAASQQVLVTNRLTKNNEAGSSKPSNQLRQAITFHPIDVNRVLRLHEDALVLTLGVDGFDVRRILVDLGSLIDLLQMSTYKKMGYSPFALENQGHLLSGFNGATMTLLGDVVLPVQVDPEHLINTRTTFG